MLVSMWRKGSPPTLLVGMEIDAATMENSSQKTKDRTVRTSLVAQWLRIRLPMQETQVRALVWEDPTSRGATKPVCHNY